MLRSLDALRGEPRVLEGMPLADPAIRDINSVCGLIDMLSSLPRLGLVIEIGSYAGVSTETFLHFCDRLIAVDTWQGLDRAKRDFDARFAAHPAVSYLRLPSVEAAKLIADRAADLVYLDADHREAAVRADIEAWKPKVKPGGWIAGHDYASTVADGGVMKAVASCFGTKLDRVFSDSSWIAKL